MFHHHGATMTNRGNARQIWIQMPVEPQQVLHAKFVEQTKSHASTNYTMGARLTLFTDALGQSIC